ncbi:hypothetical protein N9917_01140 [Deltaproteobacteria bacterium]|nr:hypothetical protein [Deltaproteobacteria bacterium]
MKSESAIKHKLKQVRFRHLKKRVSSLLKERPGNCTYNHRFMHPLTNGTPTGMCVCPALEGERLCDPDWGGTEKAKACPHFQAQQSKDDIKEGFRSELGDMTFAQLAYHFPDMAALMWTLGEETADNDWEGEPDDPTEESNWVEVYGVRLRAGTPEAQEAITKLLEEVAEAGTLTTLASTLNVALEGSMSDNERLREENTRLKTEAEKPLVVADPPQQVPWWRRWFGGTDG